MIGVASEVMPQQFHWYDQGHLFTAVGLDTLGQLFLVVAVDTLLQIALDML